MQRMVWAEALVPISPNTSSPGGGEPPVDAVAGALRNLPWKWMIWLNPALLTRSMKEKRPIGPSPVQATSTLRVVVVQPV